MLLGPGFDEHLGRPPVVPADAGAVGVRDGARDGSDGRKRGVPAGHSPRRARRSHVQGLPHTVRAPQRQARLLGLSQVSLAQRLAHVFVISEVSSLLPNPSPPLLCVCLLSQPHSVLLKFRCRSDRRCAKRSSTVAAITCVWPSGSRSWPTPRPPALPGSCSPVNTSQYCERSSSSISSTQGRLSS